MNNEIKIIVLKDKEILRVTTEEGLAKIIIICNGDKLSVILEE